MRLRTLAALLPALGLLLLSGYAGVAVPADTPNASQNAVSASMGTMRAGGTSAKRGSLATLRRCACSASDKA